MNVLLTYPEDKTWFGTDCPGLGLLAMRSGDVAMSDLHRSQYSGEIHLDLAIPLCRGRALPDRGATPAASADSPSLGVVDIEVDPEKFLYPQIQDWPTPSPRARPSWSGVKATASCF